jgi:hypothetical protein
MPIEAMLWIVLPLVTAGGTALLAYVMMQARTEVLLSKEREALAAARIQIVSQEREMDARLQLVENETRRRALDEFINDLRVEERRYLRDSKSLFVNKRAMVLQERLYFRNIPLSNWVEHEMTIEEGSDLNTVTQRASTFGVKTLSGMRGSSKMIQ